MILLLGGTSETAPLAAAFAEQGWPTLVSTATDAVLELPEHALVSRRHGRLNQQQMEELICREQIRLLVDATHPFATAAHATALAAATSIGIPYLRWQRMGCDRYGEENISVTSHSEAAQRAVSFGRPILLTSGSRNLLPYTKAATTADVTLFVRVLPHPESEHSCCEAGLIPDQIIAARGPFSVEDTVQLIQRYQIGTLVTKDSGVAGGLPEKLEAARLTGCRVIIIHQPEQPDGIAVYNAIADITAALAAHQEQPCNNQK
ncbi:precorrin-6A reductase [Trichlorobacter lovleyi]|uniref:Precorrin-6x reductase n=1 Tax=Trichlorobacter lovleyi (strain ATCC BAA-1151 / DSM 17278 / SZ) TaxID=398767 RepID=B3EBR5_TRIL1|nr:precorrin-6A reductase [Trichlorobacter lovleyi]ACD97347.1 precorrin-6x reductase [Trichlorobacter lovleyi SZ]